MRNFKITYLLFVLLSIIVLNGCTKKDNLNKPILGLEGDSTEKTVLDDWLYKNFTQPYNMDVKYRWDRSEFGIQYTLVPVDTARVRAIMSVVKAAWIDLYVQEVNEAFVKKLAPKQYQLVGSLRYNGSTVTLGEAEGGSTVRIFDVNEFFTSDRTKVKRVLKTIHHEFTHILNQNINYPLVDFQSITAGGYIGTWNQTSLADAREEGFITNYAKAAPGEDFAEMASIMITEGRAGYEAIISSISSAAAKASIRKKQEIVVTYFKQVWNIDIFRMMDRCEAAINGIVPPPPPPAMYTKVGFGLLYTNAKVDTFEITNQPVYFKKVFADASLQLGTYGNAGRFIEFFTLYFDAVDKVRLRIRYKNPSNLASNFDADFAYGLSVSPSGATTLVYQGPPTESVTANNNARTIETYVTKLTKDYLVNVFQMDWPGGIPAAAPPILGGFYPVNNSGNYFLSILAN
jgi:substrate import-associated zinc metallohydrolase lipoprotein